VRAAAAAGAGFLLAVLWFDLMFDVQRDAGIDSTAAYYRRVTTTARPMNRLVAAFMALTLVGLVGEIAQGDINRAVAWVSLALAVFAIGTAAFRTVRNAVQLGAQRDDTATQRALARSIRRDHAACFVAIGAVLVLQVFAAY
jgi:hypothetical protein